MKSIVFAAAVVALACSSPASAYCPFCDAPSLTLAEQIDQSAHLLLGQWVSGEKPTNESAGISRFRILEVAKTTGGTFKPFDPTAPDKDLLELPQYIAGKKDGLYVLVGPGDRLIDWHVPSAATQDSWKYLSELPPPATEQKAQIERLAYFLDYLEHPEIKVSNDAYAEFAAAPYEIIKALSDRMPREKIRQWIMDSNTPVTRMGLYGLLLGLSGNEEDAEFMKQKILLPQSEFRLGIEGVMSGYILIAGEEGLRVLEDSKMNAKTYTNAKGEEAKLPFSETYAAMQTLRFLWAYEPDFIPKERLRESMRNLMERPDLADLVIADLCRWKDWSLSDRLFKMYDDERYNIPSVKRAIVRYYYFCVKDAKSTQQEATAAATAAATAEATAAVTAKTTAKTTDEALDEVYANAFAKALAEATEATADATKGADLPESAVVAAKYLKLLEEKDPKTCRMVLRFMRNR